MEYPTLLLRLTLMICLLLAGYAQATPLSSPGANSSGSLFGSVTQQRFLPVDQAFRLTQTEVDGPLIQLRFDIAPGYYLYRHRLAFRVDGEPSRISEITLPAGEQKQDEFFGDVEVYYNALDITLTSTGPIAGAELSIDYQGCADAGLCYPPETLSLRLPGESAAAPATQAPDRSGLLVALLLFLLAGLGLTFTPCVLPMLPILSSLVVGRTDIDRPRALILASSYVLAMALTFALVGALIGLFGAALNIQARLQSPVVLSVFALFFVIFALAMFGLFDLRLPAFVREPLERLGSRTRGGSIPGAAVMGALSTLVVSPCISAPLAGALVYISTTGDALGGAARLFALALGMGLPLLLVAVFGNALLPKSGAWMNGVKQLFGFGLLGVAIWLLERVLPGPASLALWSALSAGLAVQLGLFDQHPQSNLARLARVLALLAAFYSAALLAGALAGGNNPLQPLAPLTGQATGSQQADGYFFTVSDQSGLAERQQQASQQHAIVELYADWCISCKLMERTILADPEVRRDLDRMQRIKFDLTANTTDQRQWLDSRNLFGPPAFLFYDRNGQEITALRLVGEVSKAVFQEHARAALER